MSGFDREGTTKKVNMLTRKVEYPNVPRGNEFAAEETSSIQVDSEAIVEERSARPPAPPRASLTPARELQPTPIQDSPPQARILRVPKPRLNRD